MNILPLVFAFLIIFSYVGYGFMRDVKSYSLAETAIVGYDRAERAIASALAKRQYHKIEGEELKTKDKQPPIQKSGNYTSRRTLFPSPEISKFNLGPLVKYQGDLKLHPLYEPLAAFLRLLYQEKVFLKDPSQERVEYRLIEEIVQSAREKPDADSVAELSPRDPKLKQLFYKILKGTNQYGRAVGIPPLSHFLFCDKEGKAVSVAFASPLLLEALFDSAITGAILKHEREEWEKSNTYHAFSKADLEALCIKNPALAPLVASLQEHLNYSRRFPARDKIGGRDKKTGIALEQNY